MLSTEHYEKLVRACGALAEAPIYVDDTAGLMPLELRGKARRLKSQYDIRCIILDYLQLMNFGGRSESRQQEITTISRYIKALARELDIPIVVLSQLNRAPEGREGHKPRMSDLRESGSIEQDADIVMLLHRPEFYNPTDKPGRLFVRVAKNRHGRTDRFELAFIGDELRIENLCKKETDQ
jgi:replicative DNA helicase